MSNITTSIILGVALGAISGCSTMVQSIQAEDKELEQGVGYYLPMKLVDLKINRLPSSALKKAREASGTAKKADGAAKKLVKAAEKTLTILQRGGNIAAINKAEQSVAERKAEKIQTSEAASKAAEAVDNLVSSVEGYSDQFALGSTANIPDTSFGFTAQLNHHWFASDSLKLKITDSGLLSGANAAADDQSAEFIVALANTLTGLQSDFGDLQPAYYAYSIKSSDITTPPAGRAKCPAPADSATFDKTLKMAHLVDPIDEAEISLLNTTLMAHCYFLQIHSSAHSITDLYSTSNAAKDYVDKANTSINGLLYRMPLPLRASIYRLPYADMITPALGLCTTLAKCQHSELTKSVHSRLLTVPNGGPIRILPMERGAFTTVDYEVTFKEGMLVAYDQKRPSEALGIISIPLDIVRGVIGTVTDLVQLKVNLESKNTELLQAQTALLAAVEALEKAKSGEFPDVSEPDSETMSGETEE